MMTAVVQQDTSPELPVSKLHVEPKVLLIGKKRTLEYIAPALYRINNIGELVIKATGSLSIVTAVDVAEIVKRDMDHIATKSITVGTNGLRIATGELKRMSCIEIHLIKVSPIVVVVQPSFEICIPAREAAISPGIDIPIEAATAVEEATVIVVEKAKQQRAKRKSSRTAKKKSSWKKKKPSA